MKSGQFSIDLPRGGDDEVGRLGEALIELAGSLERRFDQVQRLAAVTQQLVEGLVLDDVLSSLFDSFRTIIPYDRIGFALLDEDGKLLRARWARSDAPEIKLIKGYESHMEGSSLQRVMKSGRPRILNDLESYLVKHPNSESTRLIVEEGMRSSLTCPLIAMGKPVGFLFFSSKEKGTYKDLHSGIFQQIAGYLSVILEKARIYQDLIELDQLKNRFLGIAAHDLRSPLNAVHGYASLMAEFIDDPPEQRRETALKIVGLTNRMVVLIEDLLDVSAIESGQLSLRLSEVNVNGFLRECLELHELLASKKDIRIELDPPEETLEVTFDPARMSQVMDNYLTNAVKFSHPGKVITLGARLLNAHLEFFVTDQGQGIPEKEIPRLFAEFGRTSIRPTAGEQSTGLGLLIVKRIVDAHGGTVGVESVPGKGSTFHARVPLTPVEPPIMK